VTSAGSTATVSASAASRLSLLKTATPGTVTQAGQQVTYSYLIVNTGDTTLTGVGATDTAFSGTGTPPTITCPVTTLAPGASTTCTGTYTVTQADVDAGALTNTATASGTTPGGAKVTSNPSTATVNTAAGAELTLTKTATPASVTAAGQTITYHYLVANTGNATLRGLSVTETQFSGSGPPPVVTCPVTTLAPATSTTCTATYTVSQEDLDGGPITNTATASGTSPAGSSVRSAASTAIVTTAPTAGLTLRKTASPTTVTGAGQTIRYQYLLTNTGGVTLTDVSVTDTAFSGTGPHPTPACPTTTLAPQETTTCTAEYVTTAADVTAGSVVDTAVATGIPSGGDPIVSDPSSATVVVRAAPRPVTVVKSRTRPGAWVVTNNGDRTLADLDLRNGVRSHSGALSEISCPTTRLAPGRSTTCTEVVTRHSRHQGSRPRPFGHRHGKRHRRH
jgi:uncharacterized repeat protein (TIGR01451 family)